MLVFFGYVLIVLSSAIARIKFLKSLFYPYPLGGCLSKVIFCIICSPPLKSCQFEGSSKSPLYYYNFCQVILVLLCLKLYARYSENVEAAQMKSGRFVMLLRLMITFSLQIKCGSTFFCVCVCK